MIHGADELFDAEWYVNEYPDVARSGLGPAEHYRIIGKRLGRAPIAALSERPSLNDVRYAIPKKGHFSVSDEVALLVTHAPGGRLKPHVLPYMRQLVGAGLSVALVAVVDRPLQILEEEFAIPAMIIVRDNAGYDFGAWAHAFKLCPTLFRSGLLIMTNDSVIPTADTAAFRAMMTRVRTSTANISGLTANHEYGWHVQSYFLAIKRKALASQVFRDFIGGIRRIDDKDEVIRKYEITFAARMQAAGLTVNAVYHGPYPNNPVIWSWRELIEGGFPFIKLLLLRKVMETYTDDKEMLDDLHQTWPTVLGDAGFDVRLVRNAIRAAELSRIPEGPNKDLIHDPMSFKKLDAVTRILE